MARNRKRRAGRTGRRGLGWIAAWLACLALVGGAYLLGRRHRAKPAPAGVEAPAPGLRRLLGPVDGTPAELRVADAAQAEALLAEVREAARADGVALGPVRREPDRIRFDLELPSGRLPVTIRWRRPPEAGPRLAVVIDDLGGSVDRARAFLDLPIPVTPAILPYLEHSADVARLARERGRVALLHLPMEPQGYPERADPGPHALLVGLSEAEVRARVRRALADVPGVSGVNNHMGSRFTQHAQEMAWVADELRRSGLFFLDSVTTARTVAYDEAVRAGVPALRRDVFLDNERTPEAVGRQIERALERALRTGQAVAIGHPHRVTLETLRDWAPRIREAGVRVVPLDELLAAQPGG